VQKKIHSSHLLEEVLAEQQDAGGNGMDIDILSSDISRGMASGGRVIG
jgi:hypothetical protein